MGPRRHRRTIGQARGLVLTALVAGCTPVATDGSDVASDVPWPPPPSGTIEGRVAEVIDGDSLIVSTEDGELEVRLAGINAPEGTDCHGDAARDRLSELAPGDVSLLVTDRDQFGRTVAGVWADGRFVNGHLVEAGSAISLADDDPWSSDLDVAAASARTAGLGLWAADACGGGPTPEVTVELTEPDPAGPDDEVLDEEVVTIRNDGGTALELGGWVLRDESTANRLVIGPDTVLAPGAELVVRSGCPPPPDIGWCTGTPIWNNAGDSALLLTPDGTVAAFDTFRR